MSSALPYRRPATLRQMDARLFFVFLRVRPQLMVSGGIFLFQITSFFLHFLAITQFFSGCQSGAQNCSISWVFQKSRRASLNIQRLVITHDLVFRFCLLSYYSKNINKDYRLDCCRMYKYMPAYRVDKLSRSQHSIDF